MSGIVYTFYSFKGGVGRSMALANIATLLALWGKRVLVIDWDLEAPGIEKYFAGHIPLDRGRRQVPGLVDLVAEIGRGGQPRWRDHLIHANVAKEATVDIITAGRDDQDYVSRLRGIDWDDLFAAHGFGDLLEQMRTEWIGEYDFVFVDSRTGITDIGGICTIHLPDVIVTLFTANQQNLEGVKDVMQRARRGHKELPVERNRLLVLPVPARDESDREYKLAEEWRARFAAELKEFFDDWAPLTQRPEDILNLLKLPYFSYWSFGERLPVLEEDPRNPKTLAGAFACLAELVKSRLDWQQDPRGVSAADTEVRRSAGRTASDPGSSIRPPRFTDDETAVTILHLSDIQLGRHHHFADDDGGFATFRRRLCDDLDQLARESGLKPDLVVLTGDLTTGGGKSEFEQVAVFGEELLAYLGLGTDRLLFVPGNHDVNRTLCEAYFARCTAEGEEPQLPYWPKWGPYLELFDRCYRRIDRYRFTELEPWTLFEIPSLKVVMAGLNSTILESHRAEDHLGFVGERQLRWFAIRLAEYERKGWLRVGLVHHNPVRHAATDEETLKDADDLRDILGDRLHVLLHGRTHQGRVEMLGPSLPVISTGSAATKRQGMIPDRPGDTPNQYQIVRFSREGLWCAARQYSYERKRWIGDQRVSKAGDRWWYSLERTWTQADTTFPALKAPHVGRTGPSGSARRHTILFLAANPSGTDRLALDEECAAIERELRMSPARDDFDFRSKWAVNVDEMMRHLNELQPTIIHFSGHGSKRAAIRVEGSPDMRLSQDVSEQAFAQVIASAAPSARVILLDACYSEAAGESLRSVVDCVIGTYGEIGDDAARAFAVSFYRALGNRRSVGNAIEQATAMLSAKQFPSESGVVFRPGSRISVSQLFLPPSVDPDRR